MHLFLKRRKWPETQLLVRHDGVFTCYRIRLAGNVCDATEVLDARAPWNTSVMAGLLHMTH